MSIIWGIEKRDEDRGEMDMTAPIREGRDCFYCGEPLVFPAILWAGSERLYLHPDCVPQLAAGLLADWKRVQQGPCRAWEREQTHRERDAESGHCMIADAIKAEFMDVQGVSVDLQTIRFSDKKQGKRFIYFTPAICQQQLLRFDQGVQVQPWSFRLPTRPAQVIATRRRVVAADPTSPWQPIESRRLTAATEKGAKAPVVRGGTAPPSAVLAHNGRGRRRVFGVKAAKGFDPSAASL